MAYQITLENIPLGCAANSGRAGDPMKVSRRGFASSEDGGWFIKLLDGFPSEVIAKAPPDKKVLPSMVDNLLAIAKADKSVTVYINELEIIASMKPKRAIKKGERVFDRDIADVHKIAFKGVMVPEDAGVIVILSKGWRKGYYYDFSPLYPDNPTPRSYDLETLLGQMMGYLIFQHMFTLTEDEWAIFFEHKWFPFISLDPPTIKEMVSYVRNAWPIDDLLPRIVSEVSSKTEQMIAGWKANSFFTSHLPILETALERYQNHDYISCVSTLFPRIEGVMRSHHLAIASPQAMKQADLTKSAVASIPLERQSSSLLLPAKFEDYLAKIYFKDFDPSNPADASRHTVGHGVAPVVDFNMKNATLAILILEQLAFSFS